MSTLFQECIEALRDRIEVISKKETIEIFDKMTANLPITPWGRIDWDKIRNTKHISSIDEIAQTLNCTENEIYILWDEASLPSIKTTLENALNVIDDVTAVSFDTWLFSPASGYVIEFDHEGDVTLGFFETKS